MHVNDRRFIDVTPHTKILAVLGDIEFAHWQCIAELVDNAFDEFQTARNELHRPTVSITLPAATHSRSEATITVKDNGRGMSLNAVAKAVSAGWSSNGRHGALGLFGMGFNISTARLGRRTTVRTSRAGDADWIEVDLDLKAITESKRFEAPYRLTPKTNPTEHGTTITISDLKSEQYDALKRVQTQNVIRQKLGDVYSYLLSKRGFSLFINSKPVKPRLPCIWDEKRVVTRQGVDINAVQHIDVPLTDKLACMSCGHWSAVGSEICEECGSNDLALRQRRIWGWIGVQRYFHKTDYGIDFLRNGRKILLKDKRVFYWSDEDGLDEPELEYPIDAKTAVGRIVGEIHCDHVNPNYQKNAFEFETHEWNQVLRAVRGTSPLRPKVAKKRELPENDSPLARLYAGFRRQDPGLNYLVPGDGHVALHDKAREWANKFRAGELEYQSDQIWYEAAYSHDHQNDSDDVPAEPGEILPGLGTGPIGGTSPLDEPPDARGTGSAEEPPVVERPEESLDKRLSAYRTKGTRLVDLSGRYHVPDLGEVELNVWVVNASAPLVNAMSNAAPVVSFMVRAPRLEIFVNASDHLFTQHGADVRDLALVEAADFLRNRARSTRPLAAIISELRHRTTSPRLTPGAMAEEAERLLEQVRQLMVVPISGEPEGFWELLTLSERVDVERRFAVEAMTGAAWDEAFRSGEFITFAPASALVRLVQRRPEAFLDGQVFRRPYASLKDQGVRDLVVERLVNPLSDLALLEEHRPKLDQDELTRIRLSCRLIGRDLTELQ
ncbi:ATP-binding protein [Actinosynnema sp. NPDC053489]|uniref:ATP-binding protein n=1 Tax=Actinosynnema sp. NPDC053489 TaxID=3363916 RepID=UPI0037CC1FF1